MRLLRKLTLTPAEVSADDVNAARAVGVSDNAIADAMRVCALFNIVNRCADALDIQLADDFDPEQYGRLMLQRGYALPVGEHRRS